MKLHLMYFSDASSSQAVSEADSENSNIAAEVSGEETQKKLTSEEEFEELIRGKFADAFNKRTKGIIDKRLGKLKGFEETVQVCAPLFESLSEKFPHIDKNDIGSLVGAYLEGEKSRADAEKQQKEKSELFSAAEEHIKKMAAKELSETLSRESSKLKEIYPSFDLQREYASSPELRSLLAAGVGLKRAFETVNLEKIMGSALRYAVTRAEKNAADALKNPTRVAESSLADRASSVKRTDVKNLTESEIMKILSEVSKGAKIIF